MKYLNKKISRNLIRKCLLIFKETSRNSKELSTILNKYLHGNTLTITENKTLNHHIKDILKIIGFTSTLLMPFGSILIIVIIKLSNKYKFNILPDSIKQSKEDL